MDFLQEKYMKLAKAKVLLQNAKDNLNWNPTGSERLFFTEKQIAQKKLMKLKVYERIRNYARAKTIDLLSAI